MSGYQLNLPSQIEDFVQKQKKELYCLREAFLTYGNHDELCSKAFDSFINHRIDDQIQSIGEYFHLNAQNHHLTPGEIDTIMHYLLKELHLIASVKPDIDLIENIRPKYLILNWLKQNLLTAYKPKEPKVKILGELFRQYVVSQTYEKDIVYERIKNYLNLN